VMYIIMCIIIAIVQFIFRKKKTKWKKDHGLWSFFFAIKVYYKFVIKKK
jgi:hypothetical protein